MGQTLNREDTFMRLTLGKIGWGVVGTLFLITPIFASDSNSKADAKADNSPAYNWAYTEEASGLLHDIRMLSAQAAEGAERLKSASRMNSLDWRTHALHLNQIKAHINTMGAKLDRLQELHGKLAPWQQKAVERVTPKAAALAAHTEEAIAHLSENQGRLWMPRYTDRVSAMSEHGEEINRTVGMFLDYGKTSGRLKGLENQIEFTGA
jgi:hypothetical protein